MYRICLKHYHGFPKQDLESIWNDSSQLDNAIDSWLGLKDSYINLQSIIMDKYIELGGSDAYSIHTVMQLPMIISKYLNLMATL